MKIILYCLLIMETLNFIKKRVKNEKLVSDMTFDNSKTKLFCISKGFIKIFKDVDNGNFSKIKEITVPEFHSLNNIGPFEVDSFDAYGCNNKTLYLEVKIILIVKEENSLSFFNISENYKLINIYKENNIDSYTFNW